MTEGNDDGSVSSSSSSSSSGGGSGVGGFSGGVAAGAGGNVVATSSYLVQVRAQVMMRDDARGGWLPRGGGGLSNVSVLKKVIHHNPQAPPPPYHHHHRGGSSSLGNNPPPLPPTQQHQPHHHHHHHPHNHHHHPLHHHHHHYMQASSSSSGASSSASLTQQQQHQQQQNPPPTVPSIIQQQPTLDSPSKEYLIYGKKICDQSVVLSCSIRKDFEYNKVMPTFHHWRSGDHKFGLTFQTAADARAFDKGVRQAVKELMDGMMEQPAYPGPAHPLHGVPLPAPSQHYYSLVDDYSPPEEDVFVAVNLPVNEPSCSVGSGPSPVDGHSGGSAVPLPQPQQPSGLPPPSMISSSASIGHQLYPHHHPPHPHPHHHPVTAALHPRISYQHRPTRPPPALPGQHPHTGTEEEGIVSTAGKDRDEGDDGVGEGGGSPADHYPYVQFNSERSPSQQQQQPLPPLPPSSSPQPPLNHDYFYPVMDMKKPESSRERRDSIASIKRANQEQQQQLAIATTMSSGGGIGYDTKRNSRSSSGGGGSGGGLVKSRLSSIVRRGRGNDYHHNSLDRGKYFNKQQTHQRGTIGHFAGIGLKQRCRHCHDNFYPDNNPKGSCEYGPDLIRSAIDTLTCIGCAQCMLYHCMSDEEGEFTRHPCTCSGSTCFGGGGRKRSALCCCCCCCPGGDGSDGSDSGDPVTVFGGGGGNEMTGLGMVGGSVSVGGDGGGVNGGSSGLDGGNCGKRWLGLTLLSLLVPCLCCYLPLRACHGAFVACGLCGARHEAVTCVGAGRPCESSKLGGKSVDGKLGSGRGGSGRYVTTSGRAGSGRFDGIGGS